MPAAATGLCRGAPTSAGVAKRDIIPGDLNADGSWIKEDGIKFEINSYDTFALEEALWNHPQKPEWGAGYGGPSEPAYSRILRLQEQVGPPSELKIGTDLAQLGSAAAMIPVPSGVRGCGWRPTASSSATGCGCSSRMA